MLLWAPVTHWNVEQISRIRKQKEPFKITKVNLCVWPHKKIKAYEHKNKAKLLLPTFTNEINSWANPSGHIDIVCVAKVLKMDLIRVKFLVTQIQTLKSQKNKKKVAFQKIFFLWTLVMQETKTCLQLNCLGSEKLLNASCPPSGTPAVYETFWNLQHSPHINATFSLYNKAA